MSENDNNDIENTSNDITPEENCEETQTEDNTDSENSDVGDMQDNSSDDENFNQEAFDYNDIGEENIVSRRSARKDTPAKKRKSVRMSAKMRKILIFAAAALMIVFTIFYIIGLSTLPDNTVMNNVYIDNINLSGMSYDETLEHITHEYLMNDTEISLLCNGHVFNIRGQDIGMSANPEDTAKRAFNYGKSGNKYINGLKNTLCMVFKHKIKPAAKTDRELLSQKINEFGIELYGEMAEHFVEIKEEESAAYVHPGHTGYNPNDPQSYTEATDTVLNALNHNKYTNIGISLKSSAPVELTLDMLDGAVYADPVDAKYIVEENEVTVSPESNGRYLDKTEAAAYLPYVYEGGEIVRIPFYVSYTDVTAETLNNKLFADTLASFSTSYRGSTANRAANVARAASLINGKILAPGEIFSFNDTVGGRTAANGFFTATEYVNGESVQGIGGGTCQVSTTLYSAVLYADLQIVHRENHVMSVGYVPLGQDATVAYGSVDFKFKNTTDYPVKISSQTDGSSVYVSIIGTSWEPSRSVELKHDVSSVGDDTLVKSTRYVYAGGELISTDSLGQSYYKPHKTPSPPPQNEG